MEEPVEAPYAAWLGDFLGEDIEPNVKAETDFSTASISADRIGVWHLPNTITADKIVCGTISTVPSLLGVGLTLKTELEKARARIAELEAEKARARIAELEAQLSTAQQRIAMLEAKPVEFVGDPNWTMPRSLLPRGL